MEPPKADLDVRVIFKANYVPVFVLVLGGLGSRALCPGNSAYIRKYFDMFTLLIIQDYATGEHEYASGILFFLFVVVQFKALVPPRHFQHAGVIAEPATQTIIARNTGFFSEHISNAFVEAYH